MYPPLASYSCSGLFMKNWLRVFTYTVSELNNLGVNERSTEFVTELPIRVLSHPDLIDFIDRKRSKKFPSS